MNPEISADKTPHEPRGKILLVDDEELFREGLATQLCRAGYECICAANADQAVDRLRREEFDLLLSDIYMPGNVGLELIQQVPQIRLGLPVILMTGHPTFDTAAKSIQLAVVGYVVKPPDKKELYPLVERAIASCRRYRHITASRKRLEAWAGQLARVERSLQEGVNSNQAAPVAEYLQLMAANLMSLMEDTERSVRILSSLSRAGTDLHPQDYVEILRRTIRALEQTKQCFKSKRIAALRRELEALVGGS